MSSISLCLVIDLTYGRRLVTGDVVAEPQQVRFLHASFEWGLRSGSVLVDTRPCASGPRREYETGNVSEATSGAVTQGRFDSCSEQF
jgi:hypothetical protein